MDGTELIALASGLGSGFSGFWLGVLVLGPKIQICWTQTHPREIAEHVRSGLINPRHLTQHSRELVAVAMAQNDAEHLAANPHVTVEQIVSTLADRFSDLDRVTLERVTLERSGQLFQPVSRAALPGKVVR